MLNLSHDDIFKLNKQDGGIGSRCEFESLGNLRRYIGCQRTSGHDRATPCPCCCSRDRQKPPHDRAQSTESCESAATLNLRDCSSTPNSAVYVAELSNRRPRDTDKVSGLASCETTKVQLTIQGRAQSTALLVLGPHVADCCTVISF